MKPAVYKALCHNPELSLRRPSIADGTAKGIGSRGSCQKKLKVRAGCFADRQMEKQEENLLEGREKSGQQ
jgi:hypothetical protein